MELLLQFPLSNAKGSYASFRTTHNTVSCLYTAIVFSVPSKVLPVVLYGCETWSFIARKEYRLRVFENRVLSGILELKADEVTGEWRRLHNRELHGLYTHQILFGLSNQEE
jgi:hypothetical protein